MLNAGLLPWPQLTQNERRIQNGSMDPSGLLSECPECARRFVDTAEVIEPIDSVERKLATKLEPINLSEEIDQGRRNVDTQASGACCLTTGEDPGRGI